MFDDNRGHDEVTDKELELKFSSLQDQIAAINTTVHASIAEGFKQVQGTITQLFDKDIQHITEHVSRHDRMIEEGYKERDELREKINENKEESKKYTDDAVAIHKENTKGNAQYWLMLVVALLAAIPGLIALFGG